MDKFTVKELKELSNEKLFITFHTNSTHMAKEQKFPQWRLKYEAQILEILCGRLGLNYDEIKEEIGGL